MTDPPGDVRSLAERRGLTPLWDELARRMGASRRPVAQVTLRSLTAEQRAAIADLLGTDRLPRADCSVSTARVAQAFGLDTLGLRALVEQLRGPLPDRAEARTARRRERQQLWEWLRQRVHTWNVDEWIERLRVAGVPGDDVPRHRERLAGVVSVLDRLPARNTSLPLLAQETLGDPHGLDRGTWAAAAVLEAVACHLGATPPRTAQEGRELWSRMGVTADALSPSVLVLGLQPGGDDPLASALRDMAAAGEPLAITLSQLQRWPVRPAARDIYIFENPSVLMEAAALGWRASPLVCTSGWPNTAALTLLAQLSTAGCILHYHGDFDPAGLKIAADLIARAGVIPWRMSARDYSEAVRGSSQPLGEVVPATGGIPRWPRAWRPVGASSTRRTSRLRCCAASPATAAQSTEPVRRSADAVSRRALSSSSATGGAVESTTVSPGGPARRVRRQRPRGVLRPPPVPARCRDGRRRARGHAGRGARRSR